MNAQFHTISTYRRQVKGHGGGITWIARAACEFRRTTVLVDVQIARRPHLRVVFSEDTTKTDRQMVKRCIERTCTAAKRTYHTPGAQHTINESYNQRG